MKKMMMVMVLLVVNSMALAADLTSKDVSKWMTSMEHLQPWLESNQDKFTAEISEPGNPEVAFKEASSALKKAGLYNEFNGKVKAQGYKDVEQWSGVTQQVTFAWMALEMEANKAQIDAMKAQYDAMKSNPDVPEQQKAMMEQMMAPALIMVKLAQKSSAADKSAVNEHRAALQVHFNQAAK